eukprot:gnl/Chilomastix_caulleri/2420.p1 GENE.gnl/Chilomastix_caulleri/2420~~gnl/Chilomastix_caulleri/2420.p1  ORF type:complete len:196 (+),score=43.89 gnl/Chilomastix_caulleri/2420:56-643(+)
MANQQPRAAAINLHFKPNHKGKGIGGHPKHHADLTHFVRWPRYIRIQRQHSILTNRMKVPAQIAQFHKLAPLGCDSKIVSFAKAYKPETKEQRKERITRYAKAMAEGKDVKMIDRPHLVFGINRVTQLIERKKAKLVLISHDVEPIDIVVWLPALCHKMGIPYAIVRSKARLGQVVGMKNCSCVAFTKIKAKHRT